MSDGVRSAPAVADASLGDPRQGPVPQVANASGAPAAGGEGGSGGPRRGVPAATVARLPLYLRAVHALADAGRATASSGELAAAAGVSPAVLRKDLSQLGSLGTRGVGYDVDRLGASIAEALGLTDRWPVVLVGVGNLGAALAGYGGFAGRGFEVVALLDVDPARVGRHVGGVAVRPLDDLEAAVAEAGDRAIGVIATPAAAAQAVCDRLVLAGVTSVLTFAPAPLAVPAGVDVRRVDLSLELQVLSFHRSRRGTPTTTTLTGVTA